MTIQNDKFMKKMIQNTDVRKAHQFCSNNKKDLLKDKKCGCFYCGKIFSPTKIEEWIDSANDTALCPYCGIDSVIGESSGFPITKEFLEKMYKYWFK